MSKVVLVIDDDRTLTRIIKKTLEEADLEVMIAHDGQEGLVKLRQVRPDLVILDIQMPNMNGYSFLFEMRKLEHGIRIPVIVLTCKEGLEEIFRVEGVSEYMIKPVASQELLQQVRKYV